jgi:DNA-binding transcriptional MerR regulator
MLVSELAERADVPLATVKYYLREGLLPAGDATGPRRAEYDDSHLRRLQILRALREVGGAPVSALQVIVDAVEDDSRPVHEVLCEISDALSPEVPVGDLDPEVVATVDAVIAAVGWSGVRPDAAARRRLVEVVQLGGAELLTVDPEILGYYARLADELCRAEIELVNPTKDRQGTLEDMVVGEAVFGEILALLRRLGHEHHDTQSATFPASRQVPSAPA